VTIGEPAGIGPDIILMAAARGGVPPFFVIGDPDMLARRAALLNIDITIREHSAGSPLPRRALAVLPLSHALGGEPGRPAAADAAGVIEAIETAEALIASGKASAMVTAPIAKKPLYEAGFAHAGHTEFLAELARRRTGSGARAVMMLAGPDLRTIPVTIHIPLAEAPRALTTELIVATGAIVAAELTERFGIAAPRLAIAGLNPHAGEGGAMGTEDEAIVAPAVRELRARGIDARGPLPADTLFHKAARATYDAALCMYHDQALIPAKALAFDEAVNVTLGLPFIRTSPDHGTAFDIAGTGNARPDSFIAALELAWRMAGGAL